MSERRNWRAACGRTRRYYIRDASGSILASGNELGAVLAKAQAKAQGAALTVCEYDRKGNKIAAQAA